MGQTKLSGSYDSLHLCGEVRGSGHLEVKNGLSVQGEFLTDSIVAKEFSLQGRLRANSLEVGCANWEGEQKFTKANIGTLQGEGQIEGKTLQGVHEISYRGMVNVEEISAPKIACHGHIRSQRVQAAALITITLDGNSRSEINELSAPEIYVTSDRPRSLLHCRTIRGQTVDLENTHSDLVEGDVVKICRGCVVQRVLYHQKLDVEGDAKVVSSSKV